MSTMHLGKIASVKFGIGGYQDAMLGIHFHFSLGDGGGIRDIDMPDRLLRGAESSRRRRRRRQGNDPDGGLLHRGDYCLRGGVHGGVLCVRVLTSQPVASSR